MESPQGQIPTERVLRDRLADNLELIEAGLTLIQVEYALPNEQGARGSVDILAKDRAGYYVVIELKRADQTARQALHELNKYVSLMAAHAGVRTDQLRCILLSTTWHELRVPFARFATDSSFHTLALQLELDKAGHPSGVTTVDIPDVTPGLETCPLHIDLLYVDRERRDSAVKEVRRSLTELNVTDYFLLIMDYEGASTRVIYPFSIYVVFAEFNEELRERIAENYFNDAGEGPDWEQWGEEEFTQSSMIARVPRDTVEVGSPDRFKASEGWRVLSTARSGAYAADLWSDDDLVGLTSAAGEKYSAMFHRYVQVANKSAWARLLSDVQYCLKGADPWPELIEAVLTDIGHHPTAEVLVHLYSPNDLVWGLAHLTRTRGDLSYMPEARIELRDERGERIYRGMLSWDGQTMPRTQADTFGLITGGLLGYFMYRTAGCAWEIDEELCAFHGLTYQLLEFLPDPDNRIYRLSVENGRVVRHEHRDDDPEIRPWAEFVEANAGYLVDLTESVDTMLF